ncbi:hypothetical protein [Streptomyces sp. WAC 01325]|uniref:hypothetical protein n=1 Tax=Streptomyces sp. WAC 01325 TaxID=2203202 RepID=UPI000F877609|nr:hypothetical protein [Streptomyces sp. WAC 01325]
MNPHDGVTRVPMAWLRAQDGARQLIAHSDARWPKASFEYRVVHDVLALTLLFAGREVPVPNGDQAQPGLLRPLLDNDVEWAVWCQGRLDADASDLPRVNKDFAAQAFRCLAASRLLGGSLDAALDARTITAVFRGAGVSVGVMLARRVLDP